jgi:mercuric reductase
VRLPGAAAEGCAARDRELGHPRRGQLVAEAATGRIRGVHAVADGAGEMITAGVYAIRAGMTVSALAGTWAPYLTMSEALRLAAQSFSRDVTRLSCCAA